MRFLDAFSIVLLDMNDTFMFGHDRFGPQEDYWATYCSFGGCSMGRESLLLTIRETCKGILEDYECPDLSDNFPTLAECLRKYGNAPEEQLPILERVFAAHEMGYVPQEHGAFLQQLSKSHQLGVVSNICARPEPWRTYFLEIGIFSAFTTLVFSSETQFIKPSPRLFEIALTNVAARTDVLFVGDSLERDIIPAKKLGLATAWIAPPKSDHWAADAVVTTLTELDEVAT